MRITTWVRGALVLAGMGLLLHASPASAEIFGLLELPSGVASGTSNVQGWAYTTTPGAELIQPFDVLIDGEVAFKVPCCGDRGDVKDANPDAPLLTGFSGVRNWGLDWVAKNGGGEVLSADSPQGISPGTQVVVQVLVTDTAGGSKLLTELVDLVHPTPWPRSKLVEWKDDEDVELIVSKDSEETQGIIILDPTIESTCVLRNNAFYEDGAASLRCTGVKYTAPDDTTFICPTVYYDWDKGSQSFRLTSDCGVFK